MTKSSFKSIGVIGAGQMGGGIAQVIAAAGYQTLIFDALEAARDKVLPQIQSRLSKAVEKGKLSSEAKSKTEANLKVVSNLNDLKDTDLIIEAVKEDLSVKSELFQKLDAFCKKETLFASNTSSISITKLAAATKRPEQFIGMHFMNPVPVMQLVEIICGLQTAPTTYDKIHTLTESLSKIPIKAEKDYPGFIVNRILMPMLNEACFALMEGVASAEQIDQAMKLGTNQPMGPLELADFVGLDVCLAVMQVLHRELGEDKYRPCPLLVKHVEAGWFGRKTGRGFHKYDA